MLKTHCFPPRLNKQNCSNVIKSKSKVKDTRLGLNKKHT